MNPTKHAGSIDVTVNRPLTQAAEIVVTLFAETDDALRQSWAKMARSAGYTAFNATLKDANGRTLSSRQVDYESIENATEMSISTLLSGGIPTSPHEISSSASGSAVQMSRQ